jgi:hypothetical protein
MVTRSPRFGSGSSRRINPLRRVNQNRNVLITPSRFGGSSCNTGVALQDLLCGGGTHLQHEMRITPFLLAENYFLKSSLLSVKLVNMAMQDDPKKIQQQIDKQNEENYGDEYEEKDQDIDEMLHEVTGDEPEPTDPADFVDKQIKEDEEDVERGTPPIGSGVTDEELEEEEEEKKPEIDSGIIEASTDTSEE